MKSTLRNYFFAATLCAATLSSATVLAAQTPPTTTTNSVGADVDNSKVNERDQAPSQLTADQQSGESDTEITRQIRQAIVQDDSLSTYAHNVKIITVNGKVTLKGPVHSSTEKMKVEKFAKSVAGVNKVDNMISIKK